MFRRHAPTRLCLPLPVKSKKEVFWGLHGIGAQRRHCRATDLGAEEAVQEGGHEGRRLLLGDADVAHKALRAIQPPGR